MQKFFLIMYLLTAAICRGQSISNNKTIAGEIRNVKGDVVPGATISLYRQKENKMLKISTSDSAGHFEVTHLDSSVYYLVCTAVGYKENHHINISLTENDLLTLQVVLEPSIKEMKEVIVKASRPLIEHKLDHTNFNVSSSPFLQGLNAIETINEAPGIEVTADGSILYNRKSVFVLIDGKPTFLTGDALAGYLRGIMAGNIDHIEFYANPPARFDAGGGGPIINIITKRIRTGLQANINTSYSQGKYPGYSASATVIYQKNKIGLLGMYNFSNSYNYYNTTSVKSFYKGDTLSSRSNSDARSTYHSINHFLKGAMDYYVNKKNTLGVMLTARFPQSNTTPGGQTTIDDFAGKYLYKELTASHNRTRSSSIIGNANFRHTFDSSGSLSVDLDYSTYKQNDAQLLTTDFFSAPSPLSTGNLSLISLIPARFKIFVGEVNYDKQFQSVKLETGIKTSRVTSDNEQQVERSTGNSYSNDNRSNHFIYTEDINALYGTLSAEKNKIKVSAGLRLEQTKGIGNQLTTQYRFTRDTLNFFPTLFMQWKYNSQNDFTFSYGKRIGRPGYQNLNPFIEIQDSLNYFQGNPYLRPYYINTYSVNHSWKNIIFSSLEYSYYRNMYANLTFNNPNNQVTLHTIENINALKLTVLTVNFVKTLWKKFNLNFSNQIYQTSWDFNRNNETNNLKKTSYYGDLKFSQSLKKGFSYQLEGLYCSQSLDMLVYTGRRGFINLSFFTKTMHDKGLLKLDLIDPFKLFYITGTLKYQDIDEYNTNHFGNRKVRLSFTYNFARGNTKIKSRTTGSEELQSRIGK